MIDPPSHILPKPRKVDQNNRKIKKENNERSCARLHFSSFSKNKFIFALPPPPDPQQNSNAYLFELARISTRPLTFRIILVTSMLDN